MKFEIISIVLASLVLGCNKKPANNEGGQIDGRRSVSHSDLHQAKRGLSAGGGKPFGNRIPAKISNSVLESPQAVIQSIRDKVGEDDAEIAYIQAVQAYPPDQWGEMLELVSLLPIGQGSNAAISAALYKLSDENPEVWLYNQKQLSEKLTKSQMRAAAFDFGKSLAKQGRIGEVLRMTASGEVEVGPELTTLFLQGLYYKIKPEDIPVAVQYLGQLSELDRISILDANPNTLGSHVIQSNVGLSWLQEALPFNQPKLAEVLGKLYAGSPVETNKVEAVAEQMAVGNEPRFLTGYFDQLADHDLNNALGQLKHLQKGKNRDAVIERLFPKIYEYDQGAALLWAQDIEDGELRNRLTKRIENHNK